MIKYHFLESGHVFLILDGERITIKSNDKRCSAVKQLLIAGAEKDKVWQAVDPLRAVSTKHLVHKDGEAFINGVKLPLALEKRFKENFDNPLQNKRIYNALLTEINRGQNDLLCLLSEKNDPKDLKIVIADEAGSIVFVQRYTGYGSYRSASGHNGYYQFDSIPREIRNSWLTDHKGDLPSYLKSLGLKENFIKKLIAYWARSDKSESFTWSVIYIYQLFDGIIDTQNLQKFILDSSPKLFRGYGSTWEHYWLDVHCINRVKQFLKETLKWSDGALLKELSSNTFSLAQLNDIATTFYDVKINNPYFAENFNVAKWIESKNFQEMQASLLHFKAKFKRLYNLHQEKHWPEITKPEWYSGRFKVVVAQTSHDLISWSEKMSNCIHSYDELAFKGNVLLLAVENKAGKMLINCEFNYENGYRNLKQFKTYGNEPNHSSELAKVRRHLILKFMVAPHINKLAQSFSETDGSSGALETHVNRFNLFLSICGFENINLVKKIDIKYILKKKRLKFICKDNNNLV